MVCVCKASLAVLRVVAIVAPRVALDRQHESHFERIAMRALRGISGMDYAMLVCILHFGSSPICELGAIRR